MPPHLPSRITQDLMAYLTLLNHRPPAALHRFAPPAAHHNRSQLSPPLAGGRLGRARRWEQGGHIRLFMFGVCGPPCPHLWAAVGFQTCGPKPPHACGTCRAHALNSEMYPKQCQGLLGGFLRGPFECSRHMCFTVQNAPTDRLVSTKCMVRCQSVVNSNKS